MELRKVLRFNGTLGLTVPNKYSRVLDLHWKDYLEVSLQDNETIIVRKHQLPNKRKEDNEEGKHPPSAGASFAI